MSNVYRFIYDSDKSEGNGVYPEASSIKARHYFEDCVAWPPILWQFCKFLESTGYVGVIDRVIIKDPYGFEANQGMFETLGPNEYIAHKDYDEEDEEDEELEEEEDDEGEDGILGVAKPGTPEHDKAMKQLQKYFNSLNEEEKKDLKEQGYNV
jgi:hypothetical protein